MRATPSNPLPLKSPLTALTTKGAGKSPNTMFKRLCKTFSAAIIEVVALYENDYSRDALCRVAPKSCSLNTIFFYFLELYEIKTVLKSDRVTVFEGYPLDEAVVCVGSQPSPLPSPHSQFPSPLSPFPPFPLLPLSPASSIAHDCHI